MSKAPEHDGGDTGTDPAIPLSSGPEVMNERELTVQTDELPEHKDFAVPRPVVGDTHIESVVVTLADGRIVTFTDPTGCIDESRIFPDVVGFEFRHVYDPSEDGQVGDDP